MNPITRSEETSVDSNETFQKINLLSNFWLVFAFPVQFYIILATVSVCSLQY
jgi:hypothetical protein